MLVRIGQGQFFLFDFLLFIYSHPTLSASGKVRLALSRQRRGRCEAKRSRPSLWSGAKPLSRRRRGRNIHMIHNYIDISISIPVSRLIDRDIDIYRERQMDRYIYTWVYKNRYMHISIRRDLFHGWRYVSIYPGKSVPPPFTTSLASRCETTIYIRQWSISAGPPR